MKAHASQPQVWARRLMVTVALATLTVAALAGQVATLRAEVVCTDTDEHDEDGPYCVCWYDTITYEEWCDGD